MKHALTVFMQATDGRASGIQQRGGGAGYPSGPIAAEKIVSERKVFFLDLKENQRGLVLKITEDVAGRRDTIMLPEPALREFIAALTRLAEYVDQIKGGEAR